MISESAHPSRQTLSAFFAGELDKNDAAPVVTHLLGECEDCRDLSHSVWREGAVSRKSAERCVSVKDLANRYFRASENATATVGALLELPANRRLLFALNSRHCHSPAVVEGLVESAYALRFEDPRELVKINELALALLEHMDPDVFSCTEVRFDFLARVHTHLGNGHGILQNFVAAARHFSQADQCLDRGSVDPLEKANSLKLRIGTKLRQNLLEDAASLAERAINIFTRCGDQHSVGESLVLLATVRTQQGESSQALALFESAVENLDPEIDSNFLLAAKHNRIYLLKELGRIHEALEEISEVIPLYEAEGQTLNRLSLKMLEAQLAEAVNQLAVAERALLEARNGFVAADLPADAAETSLELSLFYLRHGRHADARRVAKQSLPILQVVGLHDEAVAAVLVFREATLGDRLTQGLVLETLKLLQAAKSAEQ